MNRVLQQYKDEVVAKLTEQFGYTTVMQVPKIDKIVVNMGVGDAISNSKLLDAAVEDLAQITGQKPLVTKAKKSIAVFKLREGMSIGAKVTLRGERMYEFYDKLISIALPRVRDFRGVNPNSFDGRGNYTIGVKEQLIFPEIQFDEVEKVRGMDIVIVTTAKTNEEAYDLYSQGDYFNSKESLNELVEIDDEYADAWALFGRILYEQGDRNGAKMFTKRALKIDSANEDANELWLELK